VIGKSTDAQRLEISRILLSIAFKFIDVTPDEIDDLLENSLAVVADFVHADRSYIYLFEDDNKRLKLTHRFNASDIKEKIPQHDRVDSEDFHWVINPILNISVVNIFSADELPAKASTIRAIMEVEKTQSMTLCPINSNQSVIGFIGLDSVREKRKFSDDIVSMLKICGSIFAKALHHKHSTRTNLRAEQRFKRLFADIEDVVFITTPEGKFLEINPAGAKLFGYSIRDLMNLNIEEDLYVNPEERKKYKKAINSNGQVRDYELELKTREGGKIFVLATAKAVKDKNGKIVAYQGILRDVTYKRQLEQQLFQAKKMESIGMLAGGVAHDFNNILTTIIGNAELSQMELDKSHPVYHNIENIIIGVRRAEDLIHQLLAFSRRQMIEPKIVDINKEITDLHSMLERLISEDIRFELGLKKDLSYIKADPVQIQQVLVNLIVNANYAIKKQKDRSRPKKIRIITDELVLNKEFTEQYAGSREGNFILIAVQDTGIGMDEETKENIFEPFYSTKKEGEGTGLGLSTVYGIVKQNSGNIYIESDPGKGTTFKIYWPVSPDQKKPDRKPDTEIKFQKRTESILFVEDDIHVRELMCKALRTFGYNIVEAENGKEALKKIQQDSLAYKLDLLITDIVMPEMSGEELAQCMKELNPEVRVLLCSGFTDSRISMQETNGKNGHYFLAKPYTLKRLEKKIRSILDNQT